MTGTKAYYREHERDTLSNLNGGLQARESGHSEGYSVTKTDDGTYLHRPSTKGDAILTDGRIPFADGGGRLSESSKVTWGTANETLAIAGTITTENITSDYVGTWQVKALGINKDPAFAPLDVLGSPNGVLAYFHDNSSAGISLRSAETFGVKWDTASSAGMHIFTKLAGATELARIDTNGNFRITGSLYVPNMPSGANQGASGAGAGTLWYDTDDDNTVKMGV